MRVKRGGTPYPPGFHPGRRLDPSRESLGSNISNSIKEARRSGQGTLSLGLVSSALITAELTDEELNRHMETYEEVSI